MLLFARFNALVFSAFRSGRGVRARGPPEPALRRLLRRGSPTGWVVFVHPNLCCVFFEPRRVHTNDPIGTGTLFLHSSKNAAFFFSLFFCGTGDTHVPSGHLFPRRVNGLLLQSFFSFALM